MATIEQLRLKILDKPQVILGENVGVGDGSTTAWKLRLVPVMEGTVTVYAAGEELTEDEDYSLDYETGVITFETAPDEGDSIAADYSFAAFSDDDLQGFLDEAGGNLALAAGNALMSLLADRTRMVSWSKGEGKIDYGQLRKDISDTAKRFLRQGMSESGARTDEVDWEEVA
ncbi:MAG: DUF2460 domain-containing protein [bacterium]|nr:DUF2460 domain-containing protein [bacterium]